VGGAVINPAGGFAGDDIAFLAPQPARPPKMPVATECAALAYSAALVALFLNTNGCSPKYCSLGMRHLAGAIPKKKVSFAPVYQMLCMLLFLAREELLYLVGNWQSQEAYRPRVNLPYFEIKYG
jgi:hypothetical protein